MSELGAAMSPKRKGSKSATAAPGERRGKRMSILPMHSKHKDLGTGLMNGIKKDLGLK